MGGKVIEQVSLFFFFIFFIFCRLATGGVAEGENVVDKVQGGRTPLDKGKKPW